MGSPLGRARCGASILGGGGGGGTLLSGGGPRTGRRRTELYATRYKAPIIGRRGWLQKPPGGVRDRVWDKRERCAYVCVLCVRRNRANRAAGPKREKKKRDKTTRDNPKLPTTRLVSLETAASWLLLSLADLVTGFVFLSGGDQSERRTFFFLLLLLRMASGFPYLASPAGFGGWDLLTVLLFCILCQASIDQASSGG